MAEEIKGPKFGIEVTATTAPAVDALRKLSDMLKEGMTAADAAGKSQKGLAVDVAKARSAQLEATEAVRRARDAMNEHKLTVDAFGKSSAEARASQRRLEAAQRDAADAAKAAAGQLEKAAKATQDVIEKEGKATPAVKRLAGQLDKLGDDATRTAGDLRRLDLQLEATADPGRLQVFGRALGSAFGNLAAGAVSALTSALKEGVFAAIETGASYETMRIALETTVGSADKAASEFERLQKFAAATPYGVEEVTQAFIKLGNRGIEPTDRLMTSFGNTASAMGKTLDDYVEAVADAVTGENERLKEFGIVGKKNGDMIAYTFKGVTTEVKFSAEAITEYLTTIGENDFAGGMERQSQSLAGMWSTQKDNAAALADEFTQGLAPALKEIMASFGGVDENGRSFAKSLGEDVGAAAKVFVTIMREIVDTLSGENGAIAKFGLLTVATGGLYIPFKAASEAAGWMSEAIYGEEQALASVIQPATEFGGVTLEVANAMGAAIKQTDAWRGASVLLTEALRLQAQEAEYVAEQAALAEVMIGPDVPATGFSVDAKGNHNPDKKKKGPKTKEAARIFSDSESGGRGAVNDLDMYADTDVIAGQAAAAEADGGEAAAREIQSREARIASIDREIEALEAKGQAEAQQWDFIFYSVEIESEAERQRGEMQDARIERERELADFQIAHAQNDADRDAAKTRREEVEHKKRLRQIQQANAEEAKEQARKIKVFDTLNRSMQQLGQGLVDAIEAQAQGEKGAIAASVAEFAKGVRNKMILKAAEETALGVAALAGIVTAGLAAPHFAAAGVAAGAAALAGGAQAIFNGVAESQGYGAEKKAAAPASASSAAGAPASSSTASGLEAQDVPISYEQNRRNKADQVAPPVNLEVHVHGNVIGVGGVKELGRLLVGVIADHGRRGGTKTTDEFG
jgi:hypothetical protein